MPYLPSWRFGETKASSRGKQDDGLLDQLAERASAIPPPILALSAFTIGSATTIIITLIHRRYFRRFPNSDWMTPDVFEKKRWIRGVVTSVGDADNFRLYHTPGFGWRWPLKFRRIPKDLKDKTLHIRLAGVDAPEAAHWGRPAQAHSAESLAWLKSQIEGKTVRCQPLRRDQYSRIISVALLPPRLLPAFMFSGKNLSLEMLRAGWATTYEQTNAEYGPWGKEFFLKIEQDAKDHKRGMWEFGTQVETPGEYKKRHAAAGNAVPAEGKEKREQKVAARPVAGWFSKLWGN